MFNVKSFFGRRRASTGPTAGSGRSFDLFGAGLLARFSSVPMIVAVVPVSAVLALAFAGCSVSPGHRSGSETGSQTANRVDNRQSAAVDSQASRALTQVRTPGMSESIVNFSHLDHLSETIRPEIANGIAAKHQLDAPDIRIIHIYADAPSYEWVGDDDEGIACLDDAARAAVVYLRHFEISGDRDSLRKAKALLRFVMYLQADDGLFYNFVLDNDLTINRTHQNSTADEFGWWASRGVWALGTAARVLKSEDPEFSQLAAERVRRTYPHLQVLVDHYPQMVEVEGRSYPTWLVGRYGSDATSELLLGLQGMNEAYHESNVDQMIERFGDGIKRMQFGSMDRHPYLAHASYANQWHGWGNAQTQALASIDDTESALREATSFYPRLLIDGWRHSMVLNDFDGGRDFEQIAYATRGVVAGLARLYEKTQDNRFAIMAGLAGSWFTGNNVAHAVMYDAKTGRGYDGINSPTVVNKNSGAESTIEALMVILEIEQIPAAKKWMYAAGDDPVQATVAGEQLRYRVFTIDHSGSKESVSVVLNLTKQTLEIRDGETSVAPNR